MNFAKKHLVLSILILVILLSLLFILGETAVREVAQYVPPASTQTAAVSGAGSGLVAHYTFDDGTAVDSAGSYNGTISGATPTAGKIGGGMQFDATDVITSAASINVAASNQFSYSFWMQAPTLTGGAAISFGAYRACARDGTSIRCTVDGDSSGAATAGSVYDGGWHHIVFVNNGNTQTIYKNGVQAGSATETMATQGGLLRLGNKQSSSSYFGGILDDVRIYDRLLTPAEIGELFALGGGAVPPTNGSCGPAAKTYTVNESFPQGALCGVGTASNSSPSNPTSDTPSTWSCVGSNQGTTASCTATRTESEVATTFTLTVSKSGTGSGTVTGTGINCGSDCTETVNTGTSITLTAAPASGSTFTGWSGGGCSGTGTCSVTLAANTTVTATFTTSAVGTGPNWYIDKDATGANNGASWTDAWTTFAAINWTKIQPGHTIYISGGTNGKTYAGGFSVDKSGTQGSPITIRIGRDSGHNGKVTLSNINIHHHDWITINGALDDNYTPPSNLTQVQSKSWTQNIGLRLVRTGGSALYMTGPNGVTMHYVELKHEGTCVETGPASDKQCIQPIIRANFTQYGPGKNNTFKYLWIHDALGDGFEWIGPNGASGFENELAFSVIEWIGDNAFEGANGWAIHDNILGPSRWLQGHPDGIQSIGSWFRIYNNIFYDFGSAFVRLQATETNHNHIWVYNNVFLSGFHGVDAFNGYAGNGVGELSNTPIEIAQYADGIGEVVRQDWTNIIFANNTLYQGPGTRVNGAGMFWGKRDEGTQNAFVHNVVLKDSIVANNIFYEVHSGAGVSWQPFKTSLPWGTRVTYASQSDVIFDNNVIAGTRVGSDGTKPTGTGFFGSGFATGEAMAADPNMIYKNNTSVAPKFRSLSGWNFELAEDDTAALNRGRNLSSIFNYDILNRPRNVNGAWDRGAYEYQGQVDPPDDPPPLADGLVLKLDFEGDDFSGNVFADKSGAGNPADCQRNLVLGGVSKNQCPISVAGAGSVTAAKFVPIVSPITGGSTCMMASDYLAIPGKTSINNLSRGTISLWVSPEDFNYKNSKILDAFSAGVRNTWSIGRGGDTTYYQLTMNDSNGIERDILAFPGGTAAQGPWSLYTITWDGSRIKAYYNGVLSNDVPMTGISEFALGNYLAIGALKHNVARNADASGNCANPPPSGYGDPEQIGSVIPGTYVFPNAGFFTGKMDDIRIYNRALSASEVSALAQGVTVPNQHVVSVSKSGGGAGKVASSPGGIDCGKRCAEAYTAGSSIVLTATAAAGSSFTSWGGSCSGTSPTCSVSSLSSARYATANFERAGTIVASFEAESATLLLPFRSNGSSVYQPAQTSPIVANGGKLSYTFQAEAGAYLVIAKVNAPSSSNNSLYINMDAEPTGESMGWHMKTTAGFEERTASWGSNVDGNDPAKVFNLATTTGNQHTLIIRGREAGVSIDSIIILKQGTVVTTPQNGLCSTTLNQCVSGTFTDVTDTTTNNLWSCAGLYGGTTAQCSLPKTVVDTTPPVITIHSSGIVLKPSISGATLTFTTNEASTCKWGKVAGTAYASLPNTFTASTNKLSHSGDIPNLPDGVTSIYVRCSDLVTPPNINSTDTTATITITPAVVTNDADSDGVLNAADKCPLTPANTPVNVHGCPLPKATRFTVTNLASLDLNSVPNFEISNTLGKIRYTQAHKLLRSTGEPLDLDSHLSITNGIITLNSSSLPELNKPATIILSGLTLTTPKILKDGVLCTTCTQVSYTAGTLTFTVPGFSTYSVVEDDPAPQPTYALSVVTLGTGSGTITGTGISCGSDCTHTANQGTTVVLTATPNSNSTFSGWSGGVCSSTNTTCTISTTASVVATFTRIPDPTPPLDPSARTVTIEPVVTTPPAPAPVPTFIQRFIPSLTSTNVTKPRTSSPFVPLPELTPEEISTAPKLSFAEQVKSILSYIVQRIRNGFMRVFGR